MNIKDVIAQRVESWNKLGHPSLLDWFILRNGKPYEPAKRIGRKMRAKHCFNNAANFVLKKGGEYIEGFCINRNIGWPIHHAWVSMGGEDAMDPTLDASGYEYFGVSFPNTVLCKEVARNKVYGLLDPGIGLNADLMFAIDPELRQLCDEIRQRRTPMEKMTCA